MSTYYDMYDLLYCIDYVVPNKIHSFIHII